MRHQVGGDCGTHRPREREEQANEVHVERDLARVELARFERVPRKREDLPERDGSDAQRERADGGQRQRITHERIAEVAERAAQPAREQHALATPARVGRAREISRDHDAAHAGHGHEHAELEVTHAYFTRPEHGHERYDERISEAEQDAQEHHDEQPWHRDQRAKCAFQT